METVVIDAGHISPESRRHRAQSGVSIAVLHIPPVPRRRGPNDDFDAIEQTVQAAEMERLLVMEFHPTLAGKCARPPRCNATLKNGRDGRADIPGDRTAERYRGDR